MRLFKLRGELLARTAILLGVMGLLVTLGLWYGLYMLTLGDAPAINPGAIPSPGKVLTAFQGLYVENDIVKNTCLSLGLNLAGYVEAIAISIPVGFLIGLLPLFRGMFQRQVDAIRYIPLTAVTSLFIVLFGIGTSMKVHFLAFGILIYLLPVIVQRIDEVNEVYLKTVYTLGASSWQTVKTVYFPSVMSRLSDDIRVLTAISWTYIIFAEGIGAQGGIGSLLYTVGQRQFRMDRVFAMLAIIILIGVIQDRLFVRLDREFFPYKYQTKDQKRKGEIKERTVIDVIWGFARVSLTWVFFGIYILLFINEFVPILGNIKVITYLFEDRAWVIHLILWLIILYNARSAYLRWRERPIKPIESS